MKFLMTENCLFGVFFCWCYCCWFTHPIKNGSRKWRTYHRLVQPVFENFHLKNTICFNLNISLSQTVSSPDFFFEVLAEGRNYDGWRPSPNWYFFNCKVAFFNSDMRFSQSVLFVSACQSSCHGNTGLWILSSVPWNLHR